MIEQVILRISRVLGALATVSIICLAAGITVNVLMRIATRQELPAATEITELLFALAGALGLALCEAKGKHVRADAAISALPPRLSASLQLVGIALAAAWLFWFVFVSSDRAIASFFSDERRYGLYPVPFWPVRIAIALGAAALLLQLGLRVVGLGRQALGRTDIVRTGASDTQAERDEWSSF